MRCYAGVGARTLTTHRASNSFFFTCKYAKLDVFCLQEGAFPSAALLPMTHVSGVRLQPSQTQFCLNPVEKRRTLTFH